MLRKIAMDKDVLPLALILFLVEFVRGAYLVSFLPTYATGILGLTVAVISAAVFGIGVSPVWLVCLSKIKEENRASQMGILYTIWLVRLGSGFAYSASFPHGTPFWRTMYRKTSRASGGDCFRVWKGSVSPSVR
ncbi:hypothetical protein SAMN04487970_105833 [Paenibacillus tianmuensis]|uniref:Uncharacterized protein n=1 Tax=Paenibacillus tianmuensis TaxID=624147 RepID=A0A1G4TMR6_9BACL|nr:hypothetical protein SAMN04487970_105833 [Paenibacillus tianmuensis]